MPVQGMSDIPSLGDVNQPSVETKVAESEVPVDSGECGDGERDPDAVAADEDMKD